MKWALSRSTTIGLLLSPVGVLLISVTRLMIISNYNVATASTIASSGGFVNTLLGTVIPVVPIFMPYIALALLFLDRIVLGILALAAALLISPTGLSRQIAIAIAKRDEHLMFHSHRSGSGTILILGIVVPFGLLLLGFLAGVGTAELASTASTVLGIILIPAVLTLYPLPANSNYYAQQLRQPWLPVESIRLHSHERITGYVLSRANGWFVVLVAEDRTIDYLHADNVARQHVCSIESEDIGRPLVTLINAPATMRACPARGESTTPGSAGRANFIR
jgi:hypothetical protein